MVIRRFILDLKSDGSVKWAEVCEPDSIIRNAASLRSRAIEQANFATSESDSSYWQGFTDGAEVLVSPD